MLTKCSSFPVSCFALHYLLLASLQACVLALHLLSSWAGRRRPVIPIWREPDLPGPPRVHVTAGEGCCLWRCLVFTASVMSNTVNRVCGVLKDGILTKQSHLWSIRLLTLEFNTVVRGIPWTFSEEHCRVTHTEPSASEHPGNVAY